MNQNPCVYKQCCKNCTKTIESERPEMCIAIQCQEYDLCPGCGKNRSLHDFGDGKRICKHCAKDTVAHVKRAISHESELQSSGRATVIEGGVSTGNITKRIVKITAPGIPPSEFNEYEKEYYTTRWIEYKGHYRSPAAYFICHMLIIEEINLSYLNTKLLESRGEAEAEFSKQRQVAMNMLKLLTDQLPEKEASEILDDEKSMSVIYDTYIEEKKKRYVGGVARLLSPEAIALAPNLTFKVDPRELLERCGFELVEIDHAIAKIKEDRLRGNEDLKPEEVLELFGFKLNEEYALPFTVDKSMSIDVEEYDELGNTEFSVG